MTADIFIKRTQEYYNKKYNLVQLESLKGWFGRKTERSIEAVYTTMVEEFDGRFQLPLVKDLNVMFTETIEAHPALQNTAPAMSDRQITDDAGWTEEELEEARQRFFDIAKMGSK